jgi:oligopeptide/dipeptide ABC transporter ATP-binding protein
MNPPQKNGRFDMSSSNGASLLQVTDLVKHFDGGLRAVDGVSFSLKKGETLGLVGESGCGKSTIGRALLRLTEPTSGKIIYNNINLASLNHSQLQPLRKEIQIIFQDPYASLNPKMKIGRILEEPFLIHNNSTHKQNIEKIIVLLEKVELSADHIDKYPHEFSGGQRQRIGIARAIALKPKFIVADEPVSALDVSIQAQIINLLKDLQEEMGISFLFISHDMAVVEHMCHNVAVMYLGKIVEQASVEKLYSAPQHPYTQALLAAVPPIGLGDDNSKRLIKGDVPNPANPPTGCAFHPRCPLKEPRCEKETPELKQVAQEHIVACHLRG